MKRRWFHFSVDTLVEYVEVQGSCWVWQLHIRPGWGYGMAQWKGKRVPAHRAVYEMLIGEIPPGLELDHLCRNRPCVNPDHLEPVTRAENQRRGMWAKRTHCCRGHRYDKANTRIASQGHRVCRACDLMHYHRRHGL